MAKNLVPVRVNLVNECSRVIESRIREGEWSARLPGERRLAEALEVGRDTIRLALRQMEKRGLIEPAGPGARRRINREALDSEGKSGDTLRVGMLSTANLERLPGPMLLEVDHLRTALAGQGGVLKVLAPAWYRSKRPATHLKSLLDEENCHVWILHRASEAVQKAMAATGHPCLLRGYPHASVELDFLDIDWEATARHAAGQLWRKGHRRILVLTPPDSLAGVQAAVTGVQSLTEESFDPIIVQEDGTPEGIARSLKRALSAAKPPTAILTTRSRQTASAMTWLMSRGISIPGHLSVLSLAHEAFLDYFSPRVSCYHFPPEKIARRVLRRLELLTSGQSTSGSPWIMPDFHRGESLG